MTRRECPRCAGMAPAQQADCVCRSKLRRNVVKFLGAELEAELHHVAGCGGSVAKAQDCQACMRTVKS